jgi:membrane protease YdiL (CAAX protease family)
MAGTRIRPPTASKENPAAATTRPVAARGPVDLLRRFPLLSFFVIAYTISWTYVLVFRVAWPLPDTLITDTPELLGPVLSGFLMTAVLSGSSGVRQLLRRMVSWRLKARWYLVAFLAVPALYVCGLALVPGAIASYTAPTGGRLMLYPVLFLVVAIFDGPLLEEPGWRGFALPRLRERRGPVAGTVILGLLWGSWHAPQYLTPTFSADNGGLSLSGVTVFLAAAVSISIIITWVFNHTGASVLMAILIHTCINFSQALTSDLFPSAAYNEVGPVAVMSLAAAALIVATRGRLGYRPPSDHPAAQGT